MLTLLCVVCFVAVTISADQEPPFCSQLLINNAENGLHISRENNLLDFGQRYVYKELHCCFANYTTIEWYLNGTRLLAGDTDSLTTFQFSAERNQTLISHRLSERDTGVYTCIARNGTHSIEHNISFVVDTHNEYTGPPVLTVQLKNLYAWQGESRRFCCEAFTGFGNLTSSFSEVMWLDANTDGFVDEDIANFTFYNKSGGEIKGTLLMFNPVKKESFGSYTCKISNGNGPPLLYNVTLFEGDDPNMKIRTTYKGTILVLTIFTTLCVLLTAVFARWHLELNLLWKDRFGKLEEQDDRLYDVFVCYAQEDADFVLSELVPVLEDQCQYRCFAWERDSLAGEWIPETYSQGVRQSRRFLMVLSPALANNTWCIYALYIAIDAMLNLHSRIICVLLQGAIAEARKQAKSRGRYVETNKPPGKLYAKKCDIAKEEDILAVFKWIKENLGGVDILVNNAALSRDTGLTDSPTDAWKIQLDVNVLGLSICTREAVQNMRARGVDDGHIVHISSIAGHQVTRSITAMYAATKHAVMALAEGLRKDFVEHKNNMKVSVVSPGIVKTEFLNNFKNTDVAAIRKLPGLESEDVADAVLYAIATPPHVQIHEIIIKPVGEPF